MFSLAPLTLINLGRGAVSLGTCHIGVSVVTSVRRSIKQCNFGKVMSSKTMSSNSSEEMLKFEKSTPFYTMGNLTLKVSMDVFKKNRARLKTALFPKLNMHNVFVLLRGGKCTNHHSADTEYLFRQESFFHWMFGVTEPDYYGGFDLGSSETYLFIPRLPKEYEIWMGKLPTTEDVIATYDVDHVYYNDEMLEILQQLKPLKILTLYGKNSDSNLMTIPADIEGLDKDDIDDTILFPVMSNCRTIKTPEELEIIRYANQVSSDAHRFVMSKVKPGMFEYQAEAMFLSYCYYVGGCRHVAYTCICGTGDNSSVLHYGHAGAPNTKTIEDGDMCLFDMGCMYYGYASDITVSFPVNGKFTAEQKVIYNIVLDARNTVISLIKPGVGWADLHFEGLRVMLEGLTEYGMLQGNVGDMLKDGVGAVFQPHGLGHLLGCDVHDVGGYLEHCPPRPTNASALRTARYLEEGMVLTVEPGCYFIDALLDQALEDDTMQKYFVPEVVNKFRKFGGVRIEDNIVVTETGAENLTKVPRTIEEIEEFMHTVHLASEHSEPLCDIICSLRNMGFTTNVNDPFNNKMPPKINNAVGNKTQTPLKIIKNTEKTNVLFQNKQ